ncbi:MAG TPA: adenylate/guanylate cyclase domain-containing protein [Acidimicrobiales bacterium]|nr:adenylate/guanylate cyclase domain-containing protein [Acidimicrobiales bacterium]
MATEALGRLASAEDRERAIEQLRAAAGELGLEELEQRLDAAIRARTIGELAELVWDLEPVASSDPRLPGARQNVGFRLHAAAYWLTNGLLVGTWALTGHGFFWPFFPAAGWGVALGLHAVCVRSAQERRAHAEPRQLERPTPTVRVGRPPPNGSASQSARRPVVAMFIDVVDSTRLTEVIGDEEWSRIRSRCRTLLRSCFAINSGEEVSAQGDGFLARFGSSCDAVRCGIEVQRRLQSQREDTGFAPSVRIGVHAGEAMEETGDLLGTVINMAARVTTEAQPAEVLITEAVADRLDGRFELEDRGLRTLKGLSRPRHLLAVPWTD